MSTAPNYRFKLEIVDQTTGDVIVSDFSSFETIGEFGECEAVDHQVARALRFFKYVGRAKHEAENYPEQLVTRTAERIRAVVEG